MRNRVNNQLEQLVYDCFYTAKVPSDISPARHMYLPLEEIDHRSFDGIGKVNFYEQRLKAKLIQFMINFFSQFCSDGIIGYGSHRLVHYLSNFTDVYYYKFNYAGQASVFNWPRTSPYGITHADDIQYLFYTWYVDGLMNATHPDAVMVERMTRLWEQFATTGNPNNNTDEYLKDMNWPKHDSTNEFYLEIGTHMVEKNGLFLERFAVWDKLTSGVSKMHLNILLIGFILILFKILW
jgi:carboxylesterase type B